MSQFGGHSQWPHIWDTEDKETFLCLFLEGRLELEGSLEHETQRGNPQSSFCPCSSERVVLMMENELKETVSLFNLYRFTNCPSPFPHTPPSLSIQILLISSYPICPRLTTHLVLILSLHRKDKKKQVSVSLIQLDKRWASTVNLASSARPWKLQTIDPSLCVYLHVNTTGHLSPAGWEAEYYILSLQPLRHQILMDPLGFEPLKTPASIVADQGITGLSLL